MIFNFDSKSIDILEELKEKLNIKSIEEALRDSVEFMIFVQDQIDKGKEFRMYNKKDGQIYKIKGI